MLTKRQGALLRYVQRYVEENEGTPPSYQEMQDGIGLASKSGINRLIVGLEERGYIRRIPNRHRAIEIIRMPGEK